MEPFAQLCLLSLSFTGFLRHTLRPLPFTSLHHTLFRACVAWFSKSLTTDVIAPEGRNQLAQRNHLDFQKHKTVDDLPSVEFLNRVVMEAPFGHIWEIPLKL